MIFNESLIQPCYGNGINLNTKQKKIFNVIKQQPKNNIQYKTLYIIETKGVAVITGAANGIGQAYRWF